MELRPEYRDPSLMDAWFVNGQYQPTFNMQPSVHHSIHIHTYRR